MSTNQGDLPKITSVWLTPTGAWASVRLEGGEQLLGADVAALERRVLAAGGLAALYPKVLIARIVGADLAVQPDLRNN